MSGAVPPDAPFEPLDERARTLFHLQSLWGFVVFWVPAVGIAGLVGATVWSARGALAVGGVVLAVTALRALWWPVRACRGWGGRLEPDVLLVRRGVVFRTVVAIPRARIQHVDVRQGPIEQLVGLARLQVHTASGLGADGAIPGLLPQDAERLRRELVSGATRGEDGV